MAATKLPVDPKELVPAAVGLALGVALLVGFYLLAKGLGMPTFVEHWNLPRQ
jgi:hypothetical protein